LPVLHACFCASDGGQECIGLNEEAERCFATGKEADVITVEIDPVIVNFGHFMLRWYGVIVAVALAAGIGIATREAKRKGISSAVFGDAVLWGIVGGIVGARLFHVADHWEHEYAVEPIRMLYVWEGGLAIWGAVVGGLLAAAIFSAVRRVRFSVLADSVTPGLVLGQAIGRIACIITGDAVGKVTTGPLGLAYSKPGVMAPELGVYYTPTPVYEILMNLAIFAVIWRLRRRNLPDGALFLCYLVLYASGRFFVTFWSSYEILALGLNQAQWVSIVAIAVAVPWLLYLVRQQLSHRARSAWHTQ
jgi:phosphatidylglycerol:prolipoprotein diacylglycerol transferase